MGMDVSGINPTDPAGEYFRNNFWWWRPLANYIVEVAPEIARHCQYWQSNDGDGLNAARSRELSDVLTEEINTGRCAEYAVAYQAKMDAMPDEVCNLCEGTGVRTDDVGIKQGMHQQTVGELDSDERPNPRAGQKGTCNACHGAGRKRPMDTWYPFTVENVQEFAIFAKHCGGFKIY
jgi:hypothetical protein